MKTILFGILIIASSCLQAEDIGGRCDFSSAPKNTGEDIFFINDSLYKGVDDIYFRTSNNGHEFGFEGHLNFFVYSSISENQIHPVGGDSACWAGKIIYYDLEKKKWKENINFTVFVENLADPSRRKIHFKSKQYSASGAPPLCITPNRKGKFVKCILKKTKTMTTGLDNDIERVLIKHGMLSSK